MDSKKEQIECVRTEKQLSELFDLQANLTLKGRTKVRLNLRAN
ncbi:hypothetical protein GCM10026988_21330 [Vibrio panuliri]